MYIEHRYYNVEMAFYRKFSKTMMNHQRIIVFTFCALDLERIATENLIFLDEILSKTLFAIYSIITAQDTINILWWCQ